MIKGLPLTRINNSSSSSFSNTRDLHLECTHMNMNHASFDIYLKTCCCCTEDQSQVLLETGGDQWFAGLALCNYLIENPQLVRGKRCLELGAGLGLVGLTAAYLGASKVWLTDLDCQLDILRQNVELNRIHLRQFSKDNFDSSDSQYCDGSESESVCEVMRHEFGDVLGPRGLAQTLRIEVVLGSDIGYDVDLQGRLSVSVSALLAHPCFGLALLAEEVRWKDVYQWHKEALQQLVTEYNNCHCEGQVSLLNNHAASAADETCAVGYNNGNALVIADNSHNVSIDEVDVSPSSSSCLNNHGSDYWHIKLFRCHIPNSSFDSAEVEGKAAVSYDRGADGRVSVTADRKEWCDWRVSSEEQIRVDTECMKSKSPIKLLRLTKSDINTG